MPVAPGFRWSPWFIGNAGLNRTEQFAPLVTEAIARWSASGLDVAQRASLFGCQTVHFPENLVIPGKDPKTAQVATYPHGVPRSEGDTSSSADPQKSDPDTPFRSY
jgi:hypothetical protein